MKRPRNFWGPDGAWVQHTNTSAWMCFPDFPQPPLRGPQKILQHGKSILGILSISTYDDCRRTSFIERSELLPGKLSGSRPPRWRVRIIRPPGTVLGAGAPKAYGGARWMQRGGSYAPLNYISTTRRSP